MWTKARRGIKKEKVPMLFHLWDSKGLCDEILKVISHVHIKHASANPLFFFLHHNDAATTKTVCLMINWSAPWMQEKNQFVCLWLAAEGHEDRRCDHIKKNDKMTSLNVLFCPQVLKKPGNIYLWGADSRTFGTFFLIWLIYLNTRAILTENRLICTYNHVIYANYC